MKHYIHTAILVEEEKLSQALEQMIIQEVAHH